MSASRKSLSRIQSHSRRFSVAGKQRGAVHDDCDPGSASDSLLGVGEHVQQKQKLAVADPRQPWSEAAGGPAVVLRPDGSHVQPPVLSVGRIGDHVVEGGADVPVVRERASDEDSFRIAAVFRLHEQVRLADGEGLRVHLLTEQVNIRARGSTGYRGLRPRVCLRP